MTREKETCCYAPIVTPFLLANLVSDLKVKLKIKLVMGGCLWVLEEDTPPPRSVLRVILKDG